MYKLRIVIFSVIVFLLLPIASTQAAVLYLDPPEGSFGPGDSFGVKIKIDVDTSCINTVEGYISFPSEFLNVVAFVTGESLLSLWIDKPGDQDIVSINKTGELYFAGGIPGGYCGRIPGDPGESNIIGQIVFRVPGLIVSDEKKEFLDVRIEEKSRVLRNDGSGTEDSLKIRNARFKYDQKGDLPLMDWQTYVASDKIPPEPFVIEIQQDSRVYGGQYFLVFSTVDKQTGVDHYEILEIRPEEEIGVAPEAAWWEKILGREKAAPNWQTGEMPYLLTDQALGSIIKVRALDRAGNERLVEYNPAADIDYQPVKEFPWQLLLGLAAVGLLAAGLMIAVVIKIIKIIKHRKQHEEDNKKEPL